jgi:hypothetical protein
VVGLGVSACSSSANGKESNKPHATSSEPNVQNFPKEQVIYYSNGWRKIFYDNANHSGIIGDGNTISGFLAPEYEHCDGPDFVYQTESGGYSDGAFAGQLNREANSPKCADGVLTPSDFALHPAAVK